MEPFPSLTQNPNQFHSDARQHQLQLLTPAETQGGGGASPAQTTGSK